MCACLLHVCCDCHPQRLSEDIAGQQDTAASLPGAAMSWASLAYLAKVSLPDIPSYILRSRREGWISAKDATGLEEHVLVEQRLEQ